MTVNQFGGVIFLISVSFFLTACVNTPATSVETGDRGSRSLFPTPTPKSDFSIPEGWVLFPAPKPESKERRCANQTIKQERKIELNNGAVQISRYFYQPDEQLAKLPPNLRKIVSKDKNAKGYVHVEAFENGWLLGSDAGEWGGNLIWLNNDGSRKTELLNDNVRGLVKVGKEVFVLSGLAHLGTDEGKIYKLTAGEKGTLETQLLSDLKTQPQTFAVETGESFVVALNNKILRVTASGEIRILKETDFDSLYPNSMTVTPSGVIYVGMRLFAVRFVPNETGYTEEWLVPQNCQKFVEKDFDCVCQNKM
jgi:hypothetical protein